MKFDTEPAFRELINRENMNLFLGAGFSVKAANRAGESLMLGSDLRQYLINHFDLQKFSRASLPQIASHLKRNRKGDFYYLLKNLYTVDNFDPLYNSLFNLPIVNIFTVNIDNLVESVYTKHENPKKFINDVEIYGYVESPGISLFKLHGSVTYPHDREMFFSYSELSGAFLIQPSLFGTVANKIASHPTLFWGVNLDSPNIIDLLKPSTIGNRPSQPKWLVILPGEDHDVLAEEYSAEGFRIIRATTSELLSYFDSWQTQTKGTEEQIDYSGFFPHNYLPAILQRKHPVRPLSHFYQGADPSWNDIINNNLVKTSQYTTTLEKILNNGKTLLTGSPGCGKTTLLMQLAISPDISGTKFFFSDIQLSQAEFLKQKIAIDPHATIFIDNVSDSIDAYRILNALPNVTLVVADRDLRYETVKHLLDMTIQRINDISDLSSADIQKICDSMGRPTQTFPFKKVSLFEICYQLWAGNNLGTRIKDLVSQINKIDSELTEFYSLLTYVRYCGIAASMDMLFNYYGGDPRFDYHQIYKWVDTIYSMVDNSGYPEDTLQDFFTLRSVIFSEVSLKYIPSEVLRRVIVQFQRNVNRSIIPRFDIFKRKAYDADIIKKAFPDVKDGAEFYDSVIQADPSPFIKHQYALYLWRKGQSVAAWTQIDLAYTETRGSVYSINNTHAYILFANNIDKPLDADGIVLNTLDQTFEVLDNCLKMDTRISYHVMTFSNNAIRYFKRFKDEKGLAYLQKANQCIDEELKGKDYIPAQIHHQLNILLKVTNSLLKSG